MKGVLNKIIELYESKNGGLGGYGHIVFDDHNLDTETIEWCILEANKGEYDWLCEDTRQKSLIALKALIPLTEKQRKEVIEESREIIDKRIRASLPEGFYPSSNESNKK